MATNMLKNKKKTYSQSVTVKKRSKFTPDNLFLKTLIHCGSKKRANFGRL